MTTKTTTHSAQVKDVKTSTSTLANTGTPTLAMLGAGALLVAGGAGVLRLSRRSGAHR